MPSYLQIENISKSYGTKVLFENIGFHVLIAVLCIELANLLIVDK